jgi:sensory rhodopsin
MKKILYVFIVLGCLSFTSCGGGSGSSEGKTINYSFSDANSVVKNGVRYLAWFVLVGWAIYPVGYMCMDGGWLSSVMDPKSVDVWYNIADAINKIGFGLVVYGIAIAESKSSK